MNIISVQGGSSNELLIEHPELYNVNRPRNGQQQPDALTYEDIKLNGNNMKQIVKQQQQMTQQHSTPQLHSPTKSNVQENAIKYSLRVIFMFYASFGDKNNTTTLKSSKLIKLIADAQLHDLLTVTDIDILYRQITKNTESLTLTQFQQLLLKLSAIRYPNLYIVQAFHQLYNDHFQQLYDKIVHNTDFGLKLSTIDNLRNRIGTQYDPFINALKVVFQKLHSFAFPDQSQSQSKVQQQFLTFLSQFDIIPGSINQYQGQMLFIDLMFRDSIYDFIQHGKYLFTLNKFIESLVLISLMQMDYDQQITDITKFVYLMERIENSNGFTNFSKVQFQTKSESTQLMVIVNRLIQRDKKYKSLNATPHHQSRISEINELSQYMGNLKNIFQYYAQLGEPTNLISLKSIKFNKLLQSAGIIDGKLHQVDADLIYIQCTNKKKHEGQGQLKFKQTSTFQSDGTNGKMNLNQFCMALQQIAAKCFKNQITNMIEQFILPLEEQIRIEKQELVLQTLMELLQDTEITHLFSIMRNMFDSIYSYYAQTNMDATAFMKFCLDFEMANALMSQGQLLHVFHAFSTLNKSDYIDKAQFIEAISVVGVLVHSNIPSYHQRIVFLIERLTESKGAIQVVKKQGLCKNPQKVELIQALRTSYVQDTSSKIEQLNFDEIVEQAF